MTGTILWYDKRDGYGIARDEDGNEHYIDSSVIDHADYVTCKGRVTFDARTLGTCLCGYNVKVDLDHAAQLQYAVVEALNAYPVEQLRAGAREEAIARLGEIVALKGAV